MDLKEAVGALSALAHPHRLKIFRMLVEAGPIGLSAGVIAEHLQIAPSSLTFHTKGLVQAGLVKQRRASRLLLYTADFAAMNGLLIYLTENCCGGGSACPPMACESHHPLPEAVAERLSPDTPHWVSFLTELTQAGLPIEDLTEPGRHFFVLLLGQEPIGFGGYELYGEDALLRSIVVPASKRQSGAGRRMVAQVTDMAKSAGAKQLWLLTNRADAFFARLGFARRDRNVAPSSIRATNQFSSLCPDSALLMTLGLQ